MIVFKKGDCVKYIDPKSTLIDVLFLDGWVNLDISDDCSDQKKFEHKIELSTNLIVKKRGRPPLKG